MVLAALPVFTLIALLAFVAANARARRPVAFNAVAGCLALFAFVPLLLQAFLKGGAGSAANPLDMSIKDSAIVLEFIVPALTAVLVQWGLVRRRWLRLRGEDDLSLWPWIATVVGGLAVLNPYGLDIVGQAITYRPTGWLRDMMRTAALAGAAALLALVFLETYIRGRMLRRRLARTSG